MEEVILGLIYMSVGAMTSNHIAKFRERAKHELPGLQYQPRLPIQLESLRPDTYPTGPPLGGILVQPGLNPPAQRTWLLSPDDERLVQIQDDAFFSNWRRRKASYPHFETLVASFWDRFTIFRSLVAQDAAVPLQLQQIEVTYINWVPFDTAPIHEWFGPAERAELNINDNPSYPEHEMWIGSFLVKEHGVSVGRLHARQLEALRAVPPQLGAQLELQFRAPLAPGAEDSEIIDLAHLGRNSIVRAFTDLTTPRGHGRWGRII